MLLGVLLSASKCKKQEVIPAPLVSTILCDGNGSNSYFPLVNGDTWKYNHSILMSLQTIEPELVIFGTTTINSLTYFQLKDNQVYLYSTTQNFRSDLGTNDVYLNSNIDSQDYLFVPGTPILNQEWACDNGNIRKVSNLTASVNTASCHYKDLIEISVFNGETLIQREYFKKGLGRVFIFTPGGDRYTLTSTNLN